jgi:hemoglobin-like flavoprotein
MDRNDRVRNTWAKAIVHRKALASRFYALLFQKAPQTQALFRNDMEAQGEKLVSTLNYIVDHLDEAEELLPAARALAIRHVAYGVEPDHYDVVGICLIEAMDTILGPEFAFADRAAWAETYGGLVDYMLPEAYPA